MITVAYEQETKGRERMHARTTPAATGTGLTEIVLEAETAVPDDGDGGVMNLFDLLTEAQAERDEWRDLARRLAEASDAQGEMLEAYQRGTPWRDRPEHVRERLARAAAALTPDDLNRARADGEEPTP